MPMVAVRSMVKAAMGVPEITSKVLSLSNPAVRLSEAAISPDASAMVAEDARRAINQGMTGMKGEPKEEERACHAKVNRHTQRHARSG